MYLEEYEKLIKKYIDKYSPKLKNIEKEYFECMCNFTMEKMKNIMFNHREIIKNIIYEVINEFNELKNIKCCIILNGSFARGSNTLYSDLDLNYFYENKYLDKMINVENKVNYILQKILKFKGKDRIHSIVVYLPLISNKQYNFIFTNRYPIYFNDQIIYINCRENAQKLMYETYNSTRNINDLICYLNENDNKLNLNEWANCFELIYDNNLNGEYKEKRIIFKSSENILAHIKKIIKSIDNDNNYLKENLKIVSIKDLKLYYKMLVFHNFYDFLAIYFRLYSKLDSINIRNLEDENIGISKEIYNDFYYHLNLIQKLQYLLNLKNLDLSFHSTKSISLNEINKNNNEFFNSENIIRELNISKKRIYNDCKTALQKEVNKYE